jgi:lipopolysaccharide exporter
MTGTTIGQALALLLSPIITRLFSPDDFSTLEQYTMLMTILVVVVTGKYEFAIMHPKQREDARHLVIVSIRIAFFASIALLIASFFLSDWVANYYQNPDLAPWLWTLPITLFAFAIFNIINYWFSRQKNYKIAATSKVWNSVASEPLKIGTGALGAGTGGLIWSTVVGNVLAAWYCLRHFFKDEPKGLQYEKKKLWEVAREYKEYPLYTIWGSILNRLAQWAHIGVFSHYYGLYAIGFLALSRRVFMAPLNILSNSYSQVFYQRISEIEDARELQKFYHKNLVRFAALSAFLVLIVLVLPASTMGFVFGEKWTMTMQFLKLLVWWYALNFVTSSLSFITYRINMQRIALFLDILHFVLIYFAVIGSFNAGMNELDALKTLVIAKVIYFVLNIVVILFYLNRYVKHKEATS